ncbi:MAG TPA: hypothetical protein ENN98_08625 [Desulfurivibrio alkaliphilus]|uniref:NHL repeat containing protein n=1 Tax=Desulfurivibrio alkaliphilus TaxID=427923 RepID=A0A7C2TKT3_9BACT|nr:hypothetical protein [Desulfurivibrio alkaliphilus]
MRDLTSLVFAINPPAGRALLVLLLLVPVLILLAQPGRTTEPPPQEPFSVVAILSEDHQGQRLRSPSTVAFDYEQEEIYVLSGGKKGFVIYDNALFPHLFLGPGRGLTAPQGVFFDPRSDRIFVCQGRSSSHPPRLTILNGAFFPVDEIRFDQFPQAEGFSPQRGVVGRTGNIYLSGTNSRGVLVLGPDGKFQRWLSPVDRVMAPEELGLVPGVGNPLEATAPTQAPEQLDDNPLGLPPELLPQSRLRPARESGGPGRHPVTINDIVRDRDGRLFLLSEETSKVYVYSPNEDFLFSFGEKGGSSGKMSRPRGLAVDEDRKSIYVVDYMRHTILVYDTSGKFVFEFGGRGTGPLWFNFPSAIAMDRRGRLIVADLFNSRIQIIRADFDVRFPIFQTLPSATPPGGPSSEPSLFEEELWEEESLMD